MPLQGPAIFKNSDEAKWNSQVGIIENPDLGQFTEGGLEIDHVEPLPRHYANRQIGNLFSSRIASETSMRNIPARAMPRRRAPTP